MFRNSSLDNLLSRKWASQTNWEAGGIIQIECSQRFSWHPVNSNKILSKRKWTTKQGRVKSCCWKIFSWGRNFWVLQMTSVHPGHKKICSAWKFKRWIQRRLYSGKGGKIVLRFCHHHNGRSAGCVLTNSLSKDFRCLVVVDIHVCNTKSLFWLWIQSVIEREMVSCLVFIL